MMTSTTAEDKTKRIATKFDAPGLNFKAKLIGLEDVTDPRGDKMCQVAMAKSKAAVLAIGDHKQRITVNISLDGIKLIDEKTENALHHHPVHRISFISRDTNDSRAFGYVYNREDGAHQFVGIKTEKAAEPLVACLRDLFQTVVEMKRGKDKEQPQIDTPIQITEVKEENKEKQKEEREEERKVPPPHPPPPSNDLLGLDTGLEQGIQKMNAFGPGSPSAWLDDSLFQSQPATSVVVPGQTGSMSMTQPGLMVAGVGANPFPPPQPMAGIAVASAMYHQQHTYPQQQQQVPGMQNSPVFGLPPPVYPGPTPTAFPAPAPTQSAFGGMPAATWPQPQPSRGPGTDPNPTWMSFDSSLFGGGGDLSSSTGNPAAAFTSVPIHSTASGSGDPFAGSTFPDPFADLAVLPTQGQSSTAGKKVITKEDFIREPPKPTLLDLTHQQQTDPSATATPSGQGAPDPFQDPFSATPVQGAPALQDPFSAVSQPPARPRRTPYNPFSASSASSSSSEGQTFSSGNPFAESSSSHSTVDKSGAALHRSALDPDRGSVDPRDGFGAGPVTRPRPKGNTGTRPGLSLPLQSKNNADPFGISSA